MPIPLSVLHKRAKRGLLNPQLLLCSKSSFHKCSLRVSLWVAWNSGPRNAPQTGIVQVSLTGDWAVVVLSGSLIRTVLSWLCQIHTTWPCRETTLSYHSADEQEKVSDGKGHFPCMGWIQMHRKYQVKSAKWYLFILLAEVGSQGRRSYTLQKLKREKGFWRHINQFQSKGSCTD